MSSFYITEHQIPSQHVREYAHATANNQEDVLYLSVKQYTPKNNPNPQPGDVTIVGAHANAFAKELYEPLWEDVFARAAKHAWRIRSIWIADAANQGQSSVINENNLGNEPSWHDHSRDLLHLINVKRDEMPRPIIGVGHSMGGNQLYICIFHSSIDILTINSTFLALMHPRLITSLILLDPVIQEKSAEVDPSKPNPGNIAQLSTYRRTLWPSREAASESFKKSAFYKAWDARVLRKWVQYGLRDTPTSLHPDKQPPEVTLTTTPAQEVFTYLRPNYQAYGVNGKPVNRTTHADIDVTRAHNYPFYRSEAPNVYARLPELRPSLLYVFGETSVVSDAWRDDAKLARTGTGVGGSGGVAEGRVKGVTLSGVGHLIPMEAVERTADVMAEWIGSEIVRFKEEMKMQEEWRKKSLKERQQIDETWKKMIGGAPKRAKI